jgi:hypothetical protein
MLQKYTYVLLHAVLSYFKSYGYVVLHSDLHTHPVTFSWSKLAKQASAHKGLEISNIYGIVKCVCGIVNYSRLFSYFKLYYNYKSQATD